MSIQLSIIIPMYNSEKTIVETLAALQKLTHKDFEVIVVDDGRVIPNLICQALERKPLTIYGNGIQTRSFCYISDMVEGLVRLMFYEGLSGEVINLGNPEEVTILEIAKLIKNLTQSNSRITFKPLPQDDPIRRRPGITRAKEKLGWEPKMGLEKGLSRTIKYLKQDSPYLLRGSLI